MRWFGKESFQTLSRKEVHSSRERVKQTHRLGEREVDHLVRKCGETSLLSVLTPELLVHATYM